jgi:hypothetical protein
LSCCCCCCCCCGNSSRCMGEALNQQLLYSSCTLTDRLSALDQVNCLCPPPIVCAHFQVTCIVCINLSSPSCCALCMQLDLVLYKGNGTALQHCMHCEMLVTRLSEVGF